MFYIAVILLHCVINKNSIYNYNLVVYTINNFYNHVVLNVYKYLSNLFPKSFKHNQNII